MADEDNTRRCAICNMSQRTWGLRSHIARKHPQVPSGSGKRRKKIGPSAQNQMNRVGVKSGALMDTVSTQEDERLRNVVDDVYPNEGISAPARIIDVNLDSSDSESSLCLWIEDVMESGVPGNLALVIQAVSCFTLPRSVERCLDCYYVEAGGKDGSSACCRFKGFRKLCMMGNSVQGLDSSCFVTQTEHDLQQRCSKYLHEWLPRLAVDPVYNLLQSDPATANYILHHVVGYFTKLCVKEHALLRLLKDRHIAGADRDLAYWKVPETEGARELCDMCSTTIFNLHLFCEHCGFSVCRSCIHERFASHCPDGGDAVHGGSGGWTYCPYSRTSCDQPVHDPYKMAVAFMIPECNKGEILSTLFELNLLLRQQLCNITTQEALQTAIHRVPCRFLFNGELLLFLTPSAVDLAVFQDRWSRSMPVIVQNVHENMSADLWDPAVFMQSQRDEQTTHGGLISCRSGKPVKSVTLEQFWNGFTDSTCRARDKLGRIMYLKLKDFPPKEKFSVVFPRHYEDFCAALPIRQYTHPENGCFNLATKLPPYCLPPDLGPKMYTAYEMIAEPEKGTTNLHLDVSDAVNVLVNVTTPANIDKARFYADILSYLESQGVDELDLKRASERLHHIGALWTIFKPDQNSAIRSFLKGLAEECSDDDDPIHDQRVYLNSELRLRLEEEYGVTGYSFVQMLGDAVFIPAGAAHQVQNLQCCIKIAEDFVSPEGVSHCAAMSDEFRSLSKDHCNHEDKLQLSNIVAHSVRECVTALMASRSNSV